jgi:hypothetical protein
MTALSEALRFVNSLQSLQSLHLPGNSIQDDGAIVLGAALGSSSSSFQLKILDLSFNLIKHAGMCAVAAAFHRIPCLTSLNVSGNIRNYCHESSDGAKFVSRYDDVTLCMMM